MASLSKYDDIKKQFPIVLEQHLGNITRTCSKLGVSRNWFYDMCKNDAEFKQLCDDVNEVVIDFVEDHLYKQIEADVPTSTIFFLKTRAKHRGYIERNEFTGANAGPIEIKALTEPQEKMVERGLADLEAAAVAKYKASLEVIDGSNCVV